MTNRNVFIARNALNRIKSMGLKGAKADKVAAEYVAGAMAYAMHATGEDSAESGAMAMLYSRTASEGCAHLSNVLARADAAAAAAAAAEGDGDNA